MMQLTVTVVSDDSVHFLTELTATVRECKCTITEMRSSRFTHSTACYLLIQGSWNQIAKFENQLEALQKRLSLHIHSVRFEGNHDKEPDESLAIPYSLETFSLDKQNVIEAIIQFITAQGIELGEVSGSSYPAPYVHTSIFSTKCILYVPAHLPLMLLREELMDFCDQLNLDAIFEPVKR